MKKNFNLKTILTAVIAFACTTVMGQNFDEYFENNTLRVNFILGGNATEQDILIENMQSIPECMAGRTISQSFQCRAMRNSN